MPPPPRGPAIPHVRDHVPERTLTTWILLDVSASMAFGTTARLKSDVAAGVTTVVARLAARRGGRVALLTCGAPVQRLLPPRGGRLALVSLQKVLAEGVAVDGHAPGGDELADGLRRIGRIARGRGLVVVVSDFRTGPGWTRSLAGITARHDVVAVEVVDPREGELPAAGRLVLADPETGARVEADSSAAELRRRFAAAELARRDELRAALRRARVRHLEVSHGRRLAPRAGTGAPMSFQSPLFLLGLLAVPLALGRARARPAPRGPLRGPLPGDLHGGGGPAGNRPPRAGCCPRRCCASRWPAWRSRSRDPRRPSRCPTSARR